MVAGAMIVVPTRTRKANYQMMEQEVSITMTGQTEMLIGQISGRNIVRENFDEEGAFLNKQTFESGKVIDKNGYYEI